MPGGTPRSRPTGWPAVRARVRPSPARTGATWTGPRSRPRASRPRADVATMAASHSAVMAQEGAISHGPFVSDATLKALNAHTVGENVGMGQTVESIQDALMASEHHRDNILDTGFNQVGIGVVESDGL